VSLDAGDDDQVRFWVYVIRGMDEGVLIHPPNSSG